MGRRTIPDQTAILSFETSTSRYLENSFSRTVYRRRSSILRGTGGRACEWSSDDREAPEDSDGGGELKLAVRDVQDYYAHYAFTLLV